MGLHAGEIVGLQRLDVDLEAGVAAAVQAGAIVGAAPTLSSRDYSGFTATLTNADGDGKLDA